MLKARFDQAIERSVTQRHQYQSDTVALVSMGMEVFYVIFDTCAAKVHLSQMVYLYPDIRHLEFEAPIGSAKWTGKKFEPCGWSWVLLYQFFNRKRSDLLEIKSSGWLLEAEDGKSKSGLARLLCWTEEGVQKYTFMDHDLFLLFGRPKWLYTIPGLVGGSPVAVYDGRRLTGVVSTVYMAPSEGVIPIVG